MSRPTIPGGPDRRPALPPVTLVLGGARSGKSRFAEDMVQRAARPVYLATARAGAGIGTGDGIGDGTGDGAGDGDSEMAARIDEHRRRRGPAWLTVEEPLDLCGALARTCAPDRAVLVDCLTLWVTNLMLAGRAVDHEGAVLADHLSRPGGPVVLVSNEVGLGIVPDNAMARAFRDHAGRLHQAIAARADRVYFLVAGLPVTVKDTTAG